LIKLERIIEKDLWENRGSWCGRKSAQVAPFHGDIGNDTEMVATNDNIPSNKIVPETDAALPVATATESGAESAPAGSPRASGSPCPSGSPRASPRNIIPTTTTEVVLGQGDYVPLPKEEV
jgi:hypothetical protein